MSDLSQKVRSLWWEADQLAKESKAIALDADDLEWIDEAIVALNAAWLRARAALNEDQKET